MTTNYISVSMDAKDSAGVRQGRIASQFFFDDKNPKSIRTAFDEATSAFLDATDDGSQLAFFRAPTIEGPWTGFPVIGDALTDLGPEV